MSGVATVNRCNRLPLYNCTTSSFLFIYLSFFTNTSRPSFLSQESGRVPATSDCHHRSSSSYTATITLVPIISPSRLYTARAKTLHHHHPRAQYRRVTPPSLSIHSSSHCSSRVVAILLKYFIHHRNHFKY